MNNRLLDHAKKRFKVSFDALLERVHRVVHRVGERLHISAAYVVDMTTKKERGRGIAWLGTAASLGVVVGPALGGLLSQRDWHFNWSAGHFKVDSFSTPFFAAALLGLLTLLAALRWLPESLPKTSAQDPIPTKDTSEETTSNWRTLLKTLSPGD